MSIFVYDWLNTGRFSDGPFSWNKTKKGPELGVTIGKGRGILFKHTSEMRTFAYQSSLMALIVTALREIGEGNATEQQKAVIKKHLENVSEKDFSHDITLAPIWVRKELTALLN